MPDYVYGDYGPHEIKRKEYVLAAKQEAFEAAEDEDLNWDGMMVYLTWAVVIALALIGFVFLPFVAKVY